ncbi:hypothetical protein PVK06_045406 [Gossypium arboreum]|uniref:Uncharacterized protein n=1 Tax=Gossypium arboreum TaxID=29729 RepID=A0ABR0MWI4_GOSAR|nr:hypothetical protein PVK06_045406 [Gossypium arboreum]
MQTKDIYSSYDQLTKVTNQVKSVVDYLQQIKTITELTIEILCGLSSKYQEVFASIQTLPTPIKYEEFFHKLVDQELFLQHEEKWMSSPITVAVAKRNTNPSQLSCNIRRNKQCQSYRSQFFHPQVQIPWRVQVPNNAQHYVHSQLCDKYDHTACVCRSNSHNMQGQFWICVNIKMKHIKIDDLHFVQDHGGQKLSRSIIFVQPISKLIQSQRSYPNLPLFVNLSVFL